MLSAELSAGEELGAQEMLESLAQLADVLPLFFRNTVVRSAIVDTLVLLLFAICFSSLTYPFIPRMVSVVSRNRHISLPRNILVHGFLTPPAPPAPPPSPPHRIFVCLLSLALEL